MLSTFIEKYGSSLTMESSVSFVINFWINFLVNAICGMGFLSSLLPGHFPVVENPLSPHPRPGHSPLSRSIVVHFLWVMFALSTSEGAGNDGNFTRNSCKRFCDLFFNEAKTAIITIQRYAKLTRLHTGGWRGMEWDGWQGWSGMEWKMEGSWWTGGRSNILCISIVVLTFRRRLLWASSAKLLVLLLLFQLSLLSPLSRWQVACLQAFA